MTEPLPLIPVSKWTDEEWLRILREFPSDTHAHVVAEAVYRWRQEAGA